MYNGIINVYKEAGYTSHDAVAKLRGIFGQKRIGHTGTLDPAAEGVLPVCLGTATRLAGMITAKDKVYRATVLLGTITDTEDVTGRVLETRELKEDVGRLLEETVQSFVGGYGQIPPMYSAVKKDGRRLYELAREGKVAERPPRWVDIYSIAIDSVELPVFVMTVHCGKGTYIRSLCRDIGEKLGCGACMDSLHRLRSGRFSIEEAMTIGEIEERAKAGTLDEAIIPVDAMFTELPAVEAGPEHGRLVANGNKLPVHSCDLQRAGQVRMYYGGSFYGIYELSADGREYFPVRMFMPQDGGI